LRRAIRRFVVRVLGDSLRKSQVKTLAALVPGLIRSQQLGIAAIGRCLGGSAKPKNGIKRVFRFTSNEGVDVTAISRAMIAVLCQPGKIIGIAMDWTKMGNFQVLTSAVVTKHRAIPVYWTVIDELETRMKDAELDHIAALRELVPRENGPVILADRGFDDVAFLSALGRDFQLVVRSANSTCVRLQGESDFQRLSQIPIERNQVYDFGQIDFRKDDPLKIRLVIVHDRQQAEPWILLTNIEGSPPRDIVRWYRRRFEIEEAFRDLKDLRAGFRLRHYKMSEPARLGRLLVVAVLAYLFLVLMGTWGEKRGLQRDYQVNTVKHRVLAVWRLGLLLLKSRVRPPLEELTCLLGSVAMAAEEVRV